jgi:hypothetical protein
MPQITAQKREAYALARFKRLMLKYSGKLTFAGYIEPVCEKPKAKRRKPSR